MHEKRFLFMPGPIRDLVSLKRRPRGEQLDEQPATQRTSCDRFKLTACLFDGVAALPPYAAIAA